MLTPSEEENGWSRNAVPAFDAVFGVSSRAPSFSRALPSSRQAGFAGAAPVNDSVMGNCTCCRAASDV
ncbi:hypothetical protein [Kitasatospora herbaricolor]|uniref:hypothetical protein n=1 Tax=Kitasatospora herbaricolor TaxID=68217 RepID=UPI0036D956A5